MGTLKLFCCTVCSVEYMVAAESAEASKDVLLTEESGAFEPHEWAEFEAKEVSESDLDSLRFKSDEDGSTPTFREALEATTIQSIISCSEW